MPSNIELKARVQDAADLRERIRAVADAPPEIQHQTDTFFRTERGRLKLRAFGDGSGELIYYERPDRAGPKRSGYDRAPCASAGTLERVLGRALAVRGTVVKRREIYLVGRTRIHLDEVHGLGAFLELEVVLARGQSDASGERIARELLRALAVPEEALVAGAYMDLLEAGRAPAPPAA